MQTSWEVPHNGETYTIPFAPITGKVKKRVAQLLREERQLNGTIQKLFALIPQEQGEKGEADIAETIKTALREQKISADEILQLQDYNFTQAETEVNTVFELLEIASDIRAIEDSKVRTAILNRIKEQDIEYATAIGAVSRFCEYCGFSYTRM